MLIDDSRFPVGGYLPQSFIDYPGKIAAVIFTVGCNFRCPFCHNPELVDPESNPLNRLSFREVAQRIMRNSRYLDGVVVTGGEPSIHSALPDVLRYFKSVGLLVKLDTNGSNPGLLEELLRESLLDAVAMDIKAPFTEDRYSELSGVACDPALLCRIRKSYDLLRSAGTLSVTFRSTLVKGLHTEEDIREMNDFLPADRLLQPFRPGRTLGKLAAVPFGSDELLAVGGIAYS